MAETEHSRRWGHLATLRPTSWGSAGAGRSFKVSAPEYVKHWCFRCKQVTVQRVAGPEVVCVGGGRGLESPDIVPGCGYRMLAGNLLLSWSYNDTSRDSREPEVLDVPVQRRVREGEVKR